jgi:GMP synthase-like glutamine amidotransferase
LAQEFEFLIICGGSMNVDQEAQFPWLKIEKQLIQFFIKDKKIILGLCLGGQLLAEALGAKVQKHPEWEVGWQPVKILSESNPQNLMAFQWHGYSFEIPNGAKLLASSDICQGQAFLFGDQILGFQFHPETTIEWALDCASDENDFPTQTKFVQTPAEIKKGLHWQPLLEKWYFKTLDSLVFKKNSSNN